MGDVTLSLSKNALRQYNCDHTRLPHDRPGFNFQEVTHARHVYLLFSLLRIPEIDTQKHLVVFFFFIQLVSICTIAELCTVFRTRKKNQAKWGCSIKD